MAKSRVRKPSAADVKKRADQSYDNKDRGGWRNILKPNVDELVGYELPVYRPGKGDHIIDFLSWEAGDLDPATAPGSWTHVVDVWVHTRIGSNNDSFVCLDKNYGKPCGICQEREALRQEGAEDEEIKALVPKRQSVFLIWDRKDESKGVQIWAGISHHFVEKLVQNIAKDPRTGEKIYYMAAGAKEGRSVAFHVGSKKVPGIGEVPDYGGYQFVMRDEDTPDWVYEQVEQIGPVDQLLDVPTYEETLRAVGQGPMESNPGDDDIPSAAARPPLRSVKQEEKEEEEDMPKGWDSGEMETEEEAKAEGECPFGGTFQEDFDNYEECDDCPQRQACGGVAEEEEEEEEPEPAPKLTPRPRRQPSAKKEEPAAKSGRRPSPRKR
uniref:Uncharacterized protein n=1 Tax=viral metagenome TaxID=1070528 RepID=A0A6M3XWI8_9ZZZZ